MTRITALLDANILFSPPLRDLLIELSCEDAFHARWTAKIHDEWIRAVSKQRPDLSQDILQQTRHLIDLSIPDCLIADYEHLIEGLTLPDKDDRHVLAAAIAGECNIIITRNFRDFPKKRLRQYDIEALAPHEFFRKLDSNKVITSACNIKKRMPDINKSQYIQALRKNRLKAVADILEKISF